MPKMCDDFFKLPSVLLALLLLCQTAHADVYETVNDPLARAFGNRVCTNRECTRIAARYINNRDEKFDPCDDFAAYACGNYEYHHNALTNFLPISSLQMVFTLHKKLEAILLSPPSRNDKPWHTLTKTFYQKCIDASTVYASMGSALLSLLDEIGGWPLLTPQWTEFSSSHEEYVADIYKEYGLRTLWQTDVGVYPQNVSEYTLYLSPSEAPFGAEEIVYLANQLGAQNHPWPEIKEFFDEILIPQRRLKSKDYDGEPTCDPLQVMKLNFPDLKLEKYVDRLLKGVGPVNPDMMICIFDVEYFKKIHTLFKDKRIFANFAASFVAYYFHNLPFTDMDLNVPPSVRNHKCLVLLTEQVLTLPLTQMYIKKHGDRDSIVPMLTEMLKAMMEVLTDKINKASWLDENTRNNALIKLARMKHSVMHPENLFDDTLLIEKAILPSEPSENFIVLAGRVLKNKISSTLAKLNKVNDFIEWIGDTPLAANAFYQPSQNKIHFGIAFLTPPYLNKNVPDYVTYATIGFVMGHEIMHGFDKTGRLYDDLGNKRNWWNDETSAKYMEKATCYVDQYEKECVNGMHSLGETIGDNVGMRLAYDTYKKVMANRGGVSEPALPGFEKFTVDEMFFLSYANAMCATPEGNKVLDPNDPHPPILIRAKETTKNMKEFSTAFNCPKKAMMNPDERCSIW